MNKELNIGNYVRTKSGIEKIICIEENFMNDDVTFYATDNDVWRSAYNGKYNGFTSRSDVIIKSSPNIIDLIEVGDVIICDNKKYAINYEFEVDYNDDYKDYEITIDDYITLFLKDGLSIVTKEQFSQMEYKIGE